MANVSFDGTELSTLGFSVLEIDGRGMADWQPTKSPILGRDQLADSGGQFNLATITRLGGSLSAAAPYNSHASLLTNLDSIKSVIDPDKGFKKLIITGDRTTYFRWARYAAMDFTERKPVFRLPFHPMTLSFENFEPYWRVTHANVTVSLGALPYNIPNVGSRFTRPVIELGINATLAATLTATINPVTLFTLGNVTCYWTGLAAETQLVSGDKLIIDSDALTVMLQHPSGGANRDVIRYYDFSGSDTAYYGGFPIIAKGGSNVTSVNAGINSMVVKYDELFV